MGGVREGQTFSVPYGSNGDLAQTEVTPFILNSNSAAAHREPSIGRWKDGLFDCLKFGPFHPSLWNAVCCPQILMAQVLTRFKLNWLGERAPDEEWQRTFGQLVGIVTGYWILTTLLSPPRPTFVADENGTFVRVPPPPVSFLQAALYNIIYFSYAIYTWVILTRLRRTIRIRYEIPFQYEFLGNWEDACVSFWCGCCSVAQLARQSCDYGQQPAACCSPTGLGGTASTNPIVTVV